ncbi:MAG: DUF4829 domain-containing protein [Gracilibacteraceae bacterium]|nr:DUF4829 domain-containing protein [Gracilibacteraceae bacterium]
MKKAVLTIGVVFVLGLLLTSCGVNAGTTKNARVVGGDSIKFDAAEIQAAQECVLKKFKDFEGCDLQKLWYDEEISNAMYGVDNVNGIVILSNFHVNAKGGDGSFNPNSDYSGWKWLLTRDSRTGGWDIKDWGYG